MTTWRWLACALVLATAAPPHRAWADNGKHAKGDDDSDDEDSSDDDQGDKDSDKDKGKADKKKADDDSDASVSDSDEDEDQDKPKPKTGGTANTLPEKQDLTGHDLGSSKQGNEFERDRFFVDKADTRKTEKGTLTQGSLTWTNFAYKESGGDLPAAAGGTTPGANNGSFSQLFTDLRLQTDFRHIAASRWEARVDARVRFVDTPDQTSTPGFNPVQATHIQSGFDGQNEYELRELWLIRNGDRTDVIIGRQFIADLAAVKIDGIRIDYAQSKEFTLLGFGGLYPLRGSRSITTDYTDLRDSNDKDIGQFVGAGGFGAAYRTPAAYGSFGGVVLAPFAGEEPRIFGTANGYWRFGSQLDLYHFAVVDLLGNNDALGAGNAGLTDLSVGANWKPNPRLRGTLSLNRVDTETLNVQANAFLSQPAAMGGTAIQNEVYIARLATSELRGSLSAGLGELQRFQITSAIAYRERPGFDLTPIGAMAGTAVHLDPASSVEVYASVTDRRSVADMRLGADFITTFAVDNIPYSRTDVTAVRAFAGRELASGKGEWEAEVAASTTKDTSTTVMTTMCTSATTCFGSSSGTIISAGGTLYYRFNRDWLGIANLYVTQTALTPTGGQADPAILGLTGFARVAYRF
ncbi:MAG TPA: hypothetical protein VMJ10_34155 [Kofleriaceae bacterium]|nr:hypothetical protein [Kofleriaceae bacterium]